MTETRKIQNTSPQTLVLSVKGADGLQLSLKPGEVTELSEEQIENLAEDKGFKHWCKCGWISAYAEQQPVDVASEKPSGQSGAEKKTDDSKGDDKSSGGDQSKGGAGGDPKGKPAS